MRNINLHNSVSKQENSDWSKGAKHQTRKNYKEINLLKKIPREHIITRVRRRVAQSEFSDSIFLSQQEVHSPPGLSVTCLLTEWLSPAADQSEASIEALGQSEAAMRPVRWWSWGRWLASGPCRGCCCSAWASPLSQVSGVIISEMTHDTSLISQSRISALCNVLWRSESVLTQTRKPLLMCQPLVVTGEVSHNTLADTGARGKWLNWCQNKQAPAPGVSTAHQFPAQCKHSVNRLCWASEDGWVFLLFSISSVMKLWCKMSEDAHNIHKADADWGCVILPVIILSLFFLSRRHSEAPAHVRTPDVPDCAQEWAPHPQLQGRRPTRAKVSNAF